MPPGRVRKFVHRVSGGRLFKPRTPSTPHAPNAPTSGGEPLPKNRNVTPEDTSGGPQNRQRVSTDSDSPETYRQRRTDAEEKAKKSKENKAQWAALGIGALAVAGIVAAALTFFIGSDGANIKFTLIKPETNADSWIPDWFSSIFTTKNLEFTWEFVNNPKNPLPTAASTVRITKGDRIDIHDLPELPFNNKTVTVVNTKGDNIFIVDSKMSNTSQINIENKGTGTIHTSFENQLDQNVSDAASGVGRLTGDALSGLFSHIGTFIFIILVCVVLYFAFNLLSSSKKSTPTPVQAA
jgi:hypothetical protein